MPPAGGIAQMPPMYQPKPLIQPNTNTADLEITPGIAPLRPWSIGEIFETISASMRRAPALYFGYTFGVWAISALINSLFFTIAAYNDSTGLFYTEIFLILPLTLIAAMALTIPPMSVQISEQLIGSNPTAGTAISRGVRSFLPLAGISAIIIFIQAVTIYLPLMLITTMLLDSLLRLGFRASFAHLSESPLLVLFGAAPTSNPLTLTFYALLVVTSIVGLYFTVRLLFVAPIIVIENATFGQAVVRSWRLTQASFWRIFSKYFVSNLLQNALVSAALTIAVGVTVPFGESLLVLFFLIFIALALSGGLAIIPINYPFNTLLYLDARIRTENLAPGLLRAAGK